MSHGGSNGFIAGVGGRVRYYSDWSITASIDLRISAYRNDPGQSPHW